MAERAEIVIGATDRTRGGFDSARRNLAQFQSQAAGIGASLGGLVGRFGAIAAGVGILGSALDRINPGSVFEAADGLNKLSQRSGIAVESLSALQFGAKLADISTEELAGALKKLNQNIAAAARGETEQAEAFRLIGVSVTDASGKVRNAGDVLADVAQAFSEYGDGPNKVALANAIGGRSFEALIPLLNGGKKGFEEARAELEAFGGVISGDLAAKSEIFRDNLTRLGVAADALKVSIAGGLVDSLARWSSLAVESARNGERLGSVWDRLLLVARSGGLGAISEAVASLPSQRQQTAQGPQTAGDFLRGDKDRTPVARPQAPALKGPGTPKARGGGGGDGGAAALLRRTLDAEIKRIGTSLEVERDLFADHNTRLTAIYDDGGVTLEAYFGQRREAQAQHLAALGAGLEQEVKVLQAAINKTPSNRPQDRLELQTRLDEVYAKQAKAQREAGQETEALERQRVAATREFQGALADLDEQIASASGNNYGADLLRNARALADARALLTKGGGDPQREAALRGALQIQADFTRARELHSQITERAATAEELFILQSQRGGADRAAVEAGIGQIRAQALADLDGLIAKTEQLAQSTTDPAVLAYFQRLRVERERAAAVADPGLERLNAVADEAGDALANAFGRAATGAGSLRDVVKGLLDDLLQLTTRELVINPIKESATGLFRGLLGGQRKEAATSAPAQALSVAATVLTGTATPGTEKATEGAQALGDLAKAALGSTEVLSALPAAAAAPLGIAFSSLGAAALAATAALRALASSSGPSVGPGLGIGNGLSALFSGKGLGFENLTGGGFGSGSSFGFEDLGQFLHGGGLVGSSDGTLRATRDLAQDEYQPVIKRNEEILKRSDPRHVLNGGGVQQQAARGGVQHINVSVPQGMSRASAGQLAFKTAQHAAFASRRYG